MPDAERAQRGARRARALIQTMLLDARRAIDLSWPPSRDPRRRGRVRLPAGRIFGTRARRHLRVSDPRYTHTHSGGGGGCLGTGSAWFVRGKTSEQTSATGSAARLRVATPPCGQRVTLTCVRAHTARPHSKEWASAGRARVRNHAYRNHTAEKRTARLHKRRRGIDGWRARCVSVTPQPGVGTVPGDPKHVAAFT